MTVCLFVMVDVCSASTRVSVQSHEEGRGFRCTCQCWVWGYPGDTIMAILLQHIACIVTVSGGWDILDVVTPVGVHVCVPVPVFSSHHLFSEQQAGTWLVASIVANADP